MSDNTLRYCNNDNCRHPRGRWQPIENFRAKNGRLYKACADCRAYQGARSRHYRQRREQRAQLPSNVPTAEYRRGLAGWLLGLVTRRTE